jgi:hypothetical protein
VERVSVATIEVSNVPEDRIDIRVLAGVPFRFTLPVLDENGGPVPAVDMSAARVHVRAAIDDSIILHTFSTEDGEPDAEIDDGAVILTAVSEVTSSWQENWPGRAPETYAWWDLEVTDSDGEPRQITTPGMFTVVHQVTR